MSGEIGVTNETFTAARSALDSSRGEFAGKATSKVASLTSAQTAGKWGVESGPVAARQQYTTALQEIQDAITALNAEVIAFLSAADKTQALMNNNEQDGITATQILMEQELDAREQAEAQAEKEERGVQTAHKAGQVFLQNAKTLTGLPNSLLGSSSTNPDPQQLGPVAADDASSSTPQLQLPPTFLGGTGQGSEMWEDPLGLGSPKPRTPTSGLPTWNASGGFGRN